MKALLVILCMLLASCSPEFKVELFNHCGVPITVYSGDQRYEIAPNTSTLIMPPLDQVLKLVAGKSVLTFRERSPRPPTQYYQRGFNSVTVKFQINEDLRIYALAIDETFPFANLHSQPSGFPLVPTSNE